MGELVYGEDGDNNFKLFSLAGVLSSRAVSQGNSPTVGFGLQIILNEGEVPLSSLKSEYHPFTENPNYKLESYSYSYEYRFFTDYLYLYLQIPMISRTALTLKSNDEEQLHERWDGILPFFINPFSRNTDIIGSQTGIGIGIIFFKTLILRYSGIRVLIPSGVVDTKNQELMDLCKEESCLTSEVVQMLSVGFEF